MGKFVLAGCFTPNSIGRIVVIHSELYNNHDRFSSYLIGTSMKKSRFFKESKLRKYKDKALDLIEKGKYEKALNIYRDILEAFPNDAAIMLKVGDLCKKMKLYPEAVAIYSAAAEYHAQSGRLLQAIAVCRLILEIDDSHRDTQRKLASLYAQKYGSSEVTGIQNLKKIIAGPPKDESNPITEAPLRPEKIATIKNANLVAATPENQSGTIETELSASKTGFITEEVDTISDHDTLASDDTSSLRLDFTPLFENDEEPSAVYEQADLDEYLAELRAAGISEEVGEDDNSSLDDTGPMASRNLVLKISKPAPSPDTLPPMPLFSSLSEGALVDLISELPLRHFDALKTVVKEGEHGDSFFIIISGSVEIFKNGESLATLEEGAFFGEMAMLFPGPRQATVVTVEPCDLFEVSNEQLESLKRNHPRVGRVLLEFAEERLLSNLLNTSPIFAPFCESERQSLMDKFEPYLVEAGSVIIQQGEQSHGLYLIVLGLVSVTIQGENGEPIEVDVLKGNDSFGEVSLLSRTGSITTVTAIEPTRVLMLPRRRFNELIMTHPQVLEVVSQLSEEQLAAMNAIKNNITRERDFF